jgi:hypothetical protein
MNIRGWITAQIFLSSKGDSALAVHEVEYHLATKELRCSCSMYKLKDTCKHTAHVKSLMDSNDGNIVIPYKGNIPKDELEEAEKDSSKLRELLLKHSEIMVV